MQEVTLKQADLDFRSKEAFKTLRTNIEFSGNKIKCVFFTSTIPNEGKSTVAFETAASFAESGKKTLFIDGDLRKSVLKNRYKTGRIQFGFTHYLIGRNDWEEVICSTNVSNLFLVFAGPVPPNPTELLVGDRFSDFIEKVKEEFDFIVIDAPPVGSVIDAAIISRQCDGGIMVIGSGETSYRYARKTKEQLEKAGCKIFGCVLNKASVGGKGYYGKYYGRYYGRYYGKYYGKYYGNYYGNEDGNQ